MKYRKSCRYIGFLLAMLLVFGICSRTVDVAAIGPLEVDHACSLTISIGNDLNLEPVHVRIYKVADVDAYGAYTVCSEFGPCLRSEEIPSQGGALEAWESLASRCAEYADDGSVLLTAEAELVRSGDSGAEHMMACVGMLECGLYLVYPDLTANEDYTKIYVFTPYLMALPSSSFSISGGGSDEWVYNASMSLKPKEYNASTNHIIRVRFDGDEGHEDERPDKIVSAVSKDNVLVGYTGVTASNDWTCSWHSYDSLERWDLDEVFLEFNSLPRTASSDAELIEETSSDGLTKTIYVQNNGSSDVFVRARAYDPPGYKATYASSDGSWQVDADDWWYYSADMVGSGERTSDLEIRLERIDSSADGFGDPAYVPVMYETVTGSYDVEGGLFAEWAPTDGTGPHSDYRFVGLDHSYEEMGATEPDMFVETFTIIYEYAGGSSKSRSVSDESVTSLFGLDRNDDEPAGDGFVFDVALTAADGSVVAGEYPVLAPPGDEIGRIVDGEGWFVLQPDQTFLIPGLPDGTCYEITERERSGWKTVGTFHTTGTTQAGVTQLSSVVNGTADIVDADAVGYELPKTGGTGTMQYIAAGFSAALLAGLLLFRRKKRR